jgi:hypothetical protein
MRAAEYNEIIAMQELHVVQRIQEQHKTVKVILKGKGFSI